MNTLTPRTDEQHGWQERLKYPQYLPTVPAEFARQLERELAEAVAYADRLADSLREGTLPKDVEVLREANAGLAAENDQLRAEVERLKRHFKDGGVNWDALNDLMAKNNKLFDDLHAEVLQLRPCVKELEADKARLLDVLKRAQSDMDMLAEDGAILDRQFFNYIDAAIDAARAEREGGVK